MDSVSVIIPTWNRVDTIKKAILSTLNQTVQPLEVLVCDDGSSDSTADVVKSIDDPRVMWIHGPHSGLPAVPRNRGINNCKGDWVAFLDSDDEWLPEKLEKQILLAKELDCKAVCSNANRLIPGRGIDGNVLTWTRDRIGFDDILHVNQIICSSAVIRKSLFSEVIGFSENPKLKAIEDYALWLRIASRMDFAFVSEPLLIYYDNPLSSVRSAYIDVWSQRKIVFDNFREWAGKQNVSTVFLKRAEREYVAAIFQSKKHALKHFMQYLRSVITI